MITIQLTKLNGVVIGHCSGTSAIMKDNDFTRRHYMDKFKTGSSTEHIRSTLHRDVRRVPQAATDSLLG